MSFVTQPAALSAAVTPVQERDCYASSKSKPHDVIVRSNIQIIRGNMQSIETNLRNLNRNFISRRIVESLHDKLKQTFEVILQTETAFRVWLQEQQQVITTEREATERQREKFLFEKLFAHFQSEIRRVQDLSEQVRDAAERAADPTSSLAFEKPNYNSSAVILDMENAGAYGEATDADTLFITQDDKEIEEFDFVSENDALLSRVVAEERLQGIRRIHAQVSQANHIFKDLANLIFSQGETLTSIETQMHDAHAHSKSATLELRQASRMQQRSRQSVSTDPMRVAVVKQLSPSNQLDASSSNNSFDSTGPSIAERVKDDDIPAVAAAAEDASAAAARPVDQQQSMPAAAAAAVPPPLMPSARTAMEASFKPLLPKP